LNFEQYKEEIYDKKYEAFKQAQEKIDNNTDKYTAQIKQREQELQEWEQRLKEEEAFVKLFTKNIIYKYTDKNKRLDEKYKKWVDIEREETKTLKEEHFAATFNLQKEIKEKLDAQQDLEICKYKAKWNYITSFLAGFIPGAIIMFLTFYLTGAITPTNP